MDPDAALGELLALTTARLTAPDADDATGPPGHTDPADPVRVAELVQSLDDWLRAGGFLPLRWALHRPAR